MKESSTWWRCLGSEGLPTQMSSCFRIQMQLDCSMKVNYSVAVAGKKRGCFFSHLFVLQAGMRGEENFLHCVRKWEERIKGRWCYLSHLFASRLVGQIRCYKNVFPTWHGAYCVPQFFLFPADCCRKWHQAATATSGNWGAEPAGSTGNGLSRTFAVIGWIRSCGMKQ